MTATSATAADELKGVVEENEMLLSELDQATAMLAGRSRAGADLGHASMGGLSSARFPKELGVRPIPNLAPSRAGVVLSSPKGTFVC